MEINQESEVKNSNVKKLENNIFKCSWRCEYFATPYITNENFYYNQKVDKIYNNKVIIEGPREDDGQDFNFDNYEEIKFENINYNYKNALFNKEIEKNNFSVKKIDISDENEDEDDCYDDEIEKENIEYFIDNIRKFVSLREINISLKEEHDYTVLLGAEELNLLIENLSTLKSVDSISITIRNPNIELSEISSKSFNNMEIKKENDCISLFYDNFLNNIKLKNKK